MYFRRLVELTEEVLLKYCSVDSVKNITVLNLHDSGLTRLKNINHLVNLEKLVVSFNGLSKLDDITSMVNCSCSLNCHNYIRSLNLKFACSWKF